MGVLFFASHDRIMAQDYGGIIYNSGNLGVYDEGSDFDGATSGSGTDSDGTGYDWGYNDDSSVYMAAWNQITGGESDVAYNITVSVYADSYVAAAEGGSEVDVLVVASDGSTVEQTVEVFGSEPASGEKVVGDSGQLAAINLTVYNGEYIELDYYASSPDDSEWADIDDIEPASGSGCSCSDGGDSGEDDSVDVTIHLGKDTAAGRGGTLVLRALDDQMGAKIYDPNILNINGVLAGGAIYQNGSLRQILTSQSFVNVVNVVPGQGYELDFYLPNQISGPDANGLYIVNGAQPYSTWIFANEDGSTGTSIRVTNIRDGATTTYDYVWNAEPPPGNRGWTLTTSGNGQTLRTETHSFTYGNVPGKRLPQRTAENRIVLNPDGTTASETTSTISYLNGRPVVTQEIVGPNSASPLVSTYDYWTDPTNPANYLRKKTVTDPNGHWIYNNAYSKTGKVLQHTEQYLNNSFSGVFPDPINRNFDTAFDSSNLSEIIRTDTESVGATVIGKKWQVLDLWGTPNPTDKNNFRKTTNAVATTNTATSWNDPSNLVSTTYLYDVTDYTIGKRKNSKFLVVNPDGTGTIYQYYIDPSTNDVTTVTTTGHVSVLPTQQNPYTAAIDQGTETTDVTDQYKNQLSQTVVNIGADGTRLTIGDLVSTAFDDFGRPTTVSYFGGKYIEQTTYGCCGLASQTDRNGVITTYTYDALRRTISTARAGVTTQTQYDAMGRRTATLIGPLGQEIIQGLSHYDSNGQLVWTKDSAGRQTTHRKTFDPNGFVVSMGINPDGSTIIQKSYEDGSTYQVTGTESAQSTEYSYGVNADGSLTTTQTPLDAQGKVISMAATQNWKDFARRLWKTITPSPSGSGNVISENFYGTPGSNSAGHLVKTTRTGSLVTLYAYNSLAHVGARGSDSSLAGAGGNGTTTETTVAYATYTPPGGTPVLVRRETSTSWVTDSNAETTVTNTAVDGSGTWTTQDGQTTSQTTAVNPANATVTQTVTLPDNSRTVTISQNDQTLNETKYSSTGEQLSQTTYTYDAYGRQVSETDARNGTTSYAYDTAGRVSTVTGPDGSMETHTYSDSNQFGGQTEAISTSGGETHVKEYYPTGQVALSYGTGEYAAQYTYDSAGRQKTLTTWQQFDLASAVGIGGAAITTWNYNDGGAMISKTYPDGTGPSYTYNDNGMIKTRTWARTVNGLPLITSYSYDSATNALAEVDYSDGTPSVIYSNFDRLGRPRQISDGSGSRRLAYTHGITTYEAYVTGPLAGFSLERSLDANEQLAELTVKQIGVPDAVYDVNYAWKSIGRLDHVSWGNDTVNYGYESNSNLVANVTFTHDGQTQLTTTKTYDNLQRLTEIDNVPSNANPLNVTYRYNGRNERTQATSEDGTYWSYSYDDLGQVNAASKNLADGTPIPGLQYGYAFDSIGNRQSATTNGRTANYYANSTGQGQTGANRLNQYGSRDVPRALDVLGSANSNAAVTVNGTPAAFTGNFWYQALNFEGNNSAVFAQVNIQGVLDAASNSLGVAAQSAQSGNLFLAAHPENFTYDADGNLLSDGRWDYGWDAENRLIQVTSNDSSVAAGAPKLKVQYAYDGQGRRIQKQVISANESVSIAFVYNGWKLLAEVNNTLPNPVVARSYAWGLDLTGTMLGAGGVGGLLMADFGNKRVNYGYDANGNVIGLVDAAIGNIVARYDYDPFGNVISLSGSLAKENIFRFSTKRLDNETGLVDYGQRVYDPALGRWLSRDPMGEMGGLNLYGYVENNPINARDPLGLWSTGAFEIGEKIAGGEEVVGGGPEDPIADIGAGLTLIGAGIVAALLPGDTQQTAPPPQAGPSPSPGQPPATAPGGSGIKPPKPPKVPSSAGQCPGDGWEWRGNGPPGSGQGAWYNPATGESLYPDLNHPAPIGPHWDWTDSAGNTWRIPPGGGTPVPK